MIKNVLNGLTNKNTGVEVEIEKHFDALKDLDPSSDQYEKVLASLEKMNNIKKGVRVSKDTQALIVANLVGILAILAFEKSDIITSKALGFVMKGRV